MFELLRLKPDAFGIDISDLSVKLIKLKNTGNGFELHSYNEETIKPGVIENGEINNRKELGKTMKKLLNNVKGEQLKTKYAAVSLPEEKSFLKVIKMPKMSSQDLQEAVYFEIENHIPLRIEDAYFDFQVIPFSQENNAKGAENYLEILFAAMPKATVDSYNFCLKKTGIQPIHLEVESLSLARSLINRRKKSDSVLLIDLGAHKTSFVFFSNGFTRFTCSSAVCAQTFTQAISRFLKVDLEKAKELKEKYGFQEFKNRNLKKAGKAIKSEDNISEKHQVFQAIIPSMTDLTEQVKKYIDFYSSHNIRDKLAHSAEINKIILSGGGSHLKGIDKFFESEIGVPVEIGNPWVNVADRHLLPLPLSYKYAIAIGLALGVTE
jgi:type IV pilus assembly protein PilM